MIDIAKSVLSAAPEGVLVEKVSVEFGDDAYAKNEPVNVLGVYSLYANISIERYGDLISVAVHGDSSVIIKKVRKVNDTLVREVWEEFVDNGISGKGMSPQNALDIIEKMEKILYKTLNAVVSYRAWNFSKKLDIQITSDLWVSAVLVSMEKNSNSRERNEDVSVILQGDNDTVKQVNVSRSYSMRTLSAPNEAHTFRETIDYLASETMDVNYRLGDIQLVYDVVIPAVDRIYNKSKIGYP